MRQVYTIEDDNALRHISDEATAVHLFGENWKDYMLELAPTSFTRFEIENDTWNIGDAKPDTNLKPQR